MFASHKKSGSLNPFPVINLRPKVELMYLLRMRRHYRRKSRRKWCRAPEIGQTPSLLERYLVLCMTDTDDVALLELQVPLLLILQFCAFVENTFAFSWQFFALS